MSYSPPALRELPGILISTYSSESVGADASGAMGWSTPATAAIVTANRAFYVPLYVAVGFTITKFWCANGTAAAAGNVEMGIYRYSDLGKIITTGSVAQAGVSVTQDIDVTDTAIPRGIYYLYFSASSTSAQYMMNSSATLQPFKAAGMAQEAAAPGSAPATATPAALSTTAQLVLFGVGVAPRTLI